MGQYRRTRSQISVQDLTPCGEGFPLMSGQLREPLPDKGHLLTPNPGAEKKFA